MDLQLQASKIRLVLFDVDGVLTDGKILLHADGTESKQFDIKDGSAIVWASRLGLTVGLLSARMAASTTQRAAQLGITLVHQGVASKLETYEQIVDELILENEQVAYMGDDVLDLPVLLGIITDGDLRRQMERAADIMGMAATDVMTRNPITLPRSTLAAQALNIMEQRKITSIVVTDGDQPKRVAGVVHLHDLWRMDLF